MLKFTTVKEGKTCLGLGISRENVKRLIEGKPIVVRMKELGVSVNGEIMIFFKETEAELLDEISEFVTADTVTHVDPKLKQ